MAKRRSAVGAFRDDEDVAVRKTLLVERLRRVRADRRHFEALLDRLHDDRADIFHELHLLGVSWTEIAHLDGITDHAAAKHARKRHPKSVAS
jgi:DNA-directed RNA polymerase specialized sigma24 family protein